MNNPPSSSSSLSRAHENGPFAPGETNPNVTARSAAELAGGLSRPQRGLAVLSNLKSLIDQAILLRPDFYTPDLIQAVIGCELVEIIDKDASSGDKIVHLSGFSGVMTPAWQDEREGDALNVGLDLIYSASGVAEALVRIQVEDHPEFCYENIVKLWGRADAEGPTFRNPPPLGQKRLWPKSHPQGGHTAQYQTQQPGGILFNGQFDFRSNGNLFSADLELRKEPVVR